MWGESLAAGRAARPADLDPLEVVAGGAVAIGEGLEHLHFVTGTSDLVAQVRLRDFTHMHEVLIDQLWPINGIQRVETIVSLGAVPVADPLNAVLPLPEEDA